MQTTITATFDMNNIEEAKDFDVVYKATEYRLAIRKIISMIINHNDMKLIDDLDNILREYDIGSIEK